MTTNMVGTELALNEMEWSRKDEWLDASRGLWMVDGMQAGWAKELGKLSFVTVYNSGHMVPYNQPINSHDLLTRLLTHKSFIDEELPVLRVKPFQKQARSDSLALNSVPVTAGSSTVQWSTAGVAMVSMLIGFVTALIVTRRMPIRGYQSIPDVDSA